MTLIFGHRLGGHYGPESSRAALGRTLAGPVDGVEADVVLSADHEIVACHDPLLQLSTADLKGWAHEHSAEALTQAHLVDQSGEPSDQHPLSLRELLGAVPANLTPQLDVKAYADPALAERTAIRCCEIIREYGCSERAEIISFFSAACEAAVDRGFPSRLVVWADYAPDALAQWALEHGIGGISCEGVHSQSTSPQNAERG